MRSFTPNSSPKKDKKKHKNAGTAKKDGSRSSNGQRDRSPLEKDDDAINEGEDNQHGGDLQLSRDVESHPPPNDVSMNTLYDAILSAKKDLKEDIKDIKSSLDFISKEIDDLKSASTKHEKDIAEVTLSQNETSKRADVIEHKIREMERYSRQYNVLFHGITENEEREDSCSLIAEFIKSELGVRNADNLIELAHRLGKRLHNKTRPIIVKFYSRLQKTDIMKRARERIQGRKIFLTQDLIKEDRELKGKLRPVMDAAFREKKRVLFTRGQLFINGARYRGPETDGYY